MNLRVPILIVVDHASNYIPMRYKNLGLSNKLLASHIAYDLNILNLSNKINNLFNSNIITSKYSRLLIDLNRGSQDPTLIPSISEKNIIPGNININRNEKNFRITKIYKPYHSKINQIILKNKIKLILSLHSFNPYFKNEKRQTEIGILSNEDRRFSDLLIKQMKKSGKFKIGDNIPYKGNLIDDTLYKHGLKKNIFHTLIEIRNDLINSEIKVNNIARFIVSSVKKINKIESLYL